MKDGLARRVDWDTAPVPLGEQILAGRPDLRCNDGRTDDDARFWVGSVNRTKSANDAALYRFDPDGGIQRRWRALSPCRSPGHMLDGGRVVRIALSGEIVQSVALPVPRPTMIAFGGQIASRPRGAGWMRCTPDRSAIGAVLSFRVEVPGVVKWDFG